jgi:hypothetical protein
MGWFLTTKDSTVDFGGLVFWFYRLRRLRRATLLVLFNQSVAYSVLLLFQLGKSLVRFAVRVVQKRSYADLGFLL